MKPPRDMSAKEYARWLNEACCIQFDEACRMAGYDPMDDYRKDALWFVVAACCVALVIIAVSAMPEFIPVAVAK